MKTTVPVALTLALALPLAAAGPPPEHVLSPRPLEDDERMATADLVREQKAQAPDLDPILVREGRVAVGLEEVFPLDAGGTAAGRRRPGRSLYCVVLTLELLPPHDDEKVFARLDVRLDLEPEDVVIRNLYPLDLPAGAPEPRRLWITTHGQVQLEDPAPAPVALSIGVEPGALAPTVRGHGRSFRDAEWSFSPRHDSGVPPGTKHLLVVLETRQDLERVEAELRVEALLAYDFFGRWTQKDLRPVCIASTWCLDGRGDCPQRARSCSH